MNGHKAQVRCPRCRLFRSDDGHEMNLIAGAGYVAQETLDYVLGTRQIGNLCVNNVGATAPAPIFRRIHDGHINRIAGRAPRDIKPIGIRTAVAPNGEVNLQSVGKRVDEDRIDPACLRKSAEATTGFE